MVSLGWTLVVLGTLLLLIASAQVVLHLAAMNTDDPLLIVLPAVLALCGLAMSAGGVMQRHVALHARVRLSTEGVIVRELGERTFRWRDITDVRPARHGHRWCVLLTLADGRRRRLPAPVSSDRRLDPDFLPQVNTMVRWWQMYR